MLPLPIPKMFWGGLQPLPSGSSTRLTLQWADIHWTVSCQGKGEADTIWQMEGPRGAIAGRSGLGRTKQSRDPKTQRPSRAEQHGLRFKNTDKAPGTFGGSGAAKPLSSSQHPGNYSPAQGMQKGLKPSKKLALNEVSICVAQCGSRSRQM